jgi:uncharacterized protein (TIGR03437 family)
MAKRTSWLEALGAVALALLGTRVASATPANPHAHFTVSGNQILRDGQPFRAVGADHFMLGYQFHGTVPNTPSDLCVDMGRKAIADAKLKGLALFRFSVFGYGQTDIQRWQQQTPQFLAELDALCDAAHEQGVLLVPDLCWNWQAFTEATGDSQGSFFKDPGSASWNLLVSYTTSVVTHLVNRDEIIMWELANEIAYICDANPPSGLASDRIASSDMIAFMQRFANIVQDADPDRPITSGYGMATAYAQHLRQKPQWDGGGSFGNDTWNQFQQYMADMHPDPISVMSVHFYNGTPSGDNQRFKSVGVDDASTISYPKGAADVSGKPLFVGEFGDCQPYTSVNPQGLFEQSVIQWCATYGIPLAAAWDFEFYQFDAVTRNEFSIDPGYNDSLLATFQASNVASAAIAAPSGPTAPTVVLTGPFEGTSLPASQPVTVTSQACDAQTVQSVALLVDGANVSTLTQLPYTFSWTPAVPGNHTLVAVATNGAGLATRSEPVHVTVTGAPSSGSLEVLSSATGWSQIAPGSFATAYGQGLSTSTGSVSPQAPSTVSLVLQDSTGASFTATLLYASPTQVNFLVPQGAAGGPATVTVTSDTGAVSSGSVEVVPVAPGIFSVGSGVAAATALVVHADGSRSSQAVFTLDPSGNVTALPLVLNGAPGDQVYLSLYGTGLAAGTTTSVTFAEIPGTVTFSGAQGVTPGLDQVNVIVPSSLAGTNGLVDVALSVNGLRANVLQIAIQ